ncbi:MAG: acyl-CoA synthetase, partial [Actinobacteria bacterium]|nr:acyl-CoA synthetase [Actinomycetota bacterium]
MIDGARWYHDVIAEAEPAPRIDRSGDDELLLYTGGTTGMPKGVIWPHHELFGALAFPGYMAAGLDVPTTIDAVAGTAAAIRGSGHSPVMLCAPPLMHGTALFLAMSAFVMGGTVVLLGGRSFDADELWDLVERYQVTQISLVGDAFARPMTAALAARAEAGSPRNLASLQRIASTGATLSADQKRALAAHAPNLMILDMIGASEGGPFGVSATMPGDEPTDTAVFTAPPNVVTLDPDTHEVIPRGSDTPGMLAVSGPMPAGYLGDPDKTGQN